MSSGEIKRDYDCVEGKVPGHSDGCLPQNNPGLTPHVIESPGWKATNDPAGASMNKAQPYGKGGSGYTTGS